MRSATTILGIISERGKKGLPLERVYRLLFNRDLYLMAYGKLYRNKGALTPGSTSETVDAMSLAKMDAIIKAIRQERYRWTPVRRIYIEKKNSTKKRGLGLPTWSDKLLQEVIRLILESYFEPSMSEYSHGFRPGRGCHTALRQIDHAWLGTTWYVEGDIRACFDSLDHQILLNTLAQHIHDGRFLRLIRELLQAGYLEDWKYHATLSGAPQGGICSPILSNIYLDKLDKFIENTLIPAYTKGIRRPDNPPYTALMSQVAKLKRARRHKEASQVRKMAQQLPSQDPNDPDYRRLRYCRYADDWILGFIGPKTEAEEIKRRIKEFLREELKLELSEEKTLITHARTEAARFLNYHISTSHENTCRPKKKRHVNGKVELKMPLDVLRKKCQRYMRNGKPRHRPECLHDTDFSIVEQFQAEYRGLVEYYQLADNLHRMTHLKWVMEQSLTKTLARKFQMTVPQVYKRYKTTLRIGKQPYKGLQVIIPREGKKPLVATWGGIPLKKRPLAMLNDQPRPVWNGRTELEQRLLADTCELCGSHDRITVHHIRALKDLDQYGRREKPRWVKIMAARHRKTLIVCWPCHMSIQYGKPLKEVMDRNRV
jgi:group II intron reverse transcriptase/maturase